MASVIAAGTSYATHGRADDPVLHLLLDVRLPAHRRPVLGVRLTSSAAGFVLGATAGRTTLTGEGLQHDDGHSLLLASVSPAAVAYDAGIGRSSSATSSGTRCAGCTAAGRGHPGEDVFYYLTVYNEPIVQPAEPENVDVRGHSPRAMHRYSPR